MSALYWIAQYVPDVFRREPRNVGVLVKIGAEWSGRFIGETDSLQFDKRKLRHFLYPDVYTQWVEYWRTHLNEHMIEQWVKMEGSNFRVVVGGEVTDIADDSIESVVEYLFALLISEGGFRQALAPDSVDELQIGELQLDEEVVFALQQNQLLADGRSLALRHLIFRNFPIPGSSNVRYFPSFVQENGRLYVMETIDFTIYRKRQLRDHAGWSAYMFRDIKDARKDAETIAIVKLSGADFDNSDVADGFRLVQKEARTIDWTDTSARDEFIAERKNIAGQELEID